MNVVEISFINKMFVNKNWTFWPEVYRKKKTKQFIIIALFYIESRLVTATDEMHMWIR